MSTERDPTRMRPGELVISWVSITSLILLIVNDRVLKEHVGGWLTGKLSDLAGLVFVVLLLLSLLEILRRLRRRRTWRLTRHLVMALVVTIAVGFVLVKTVAPVTTAYLDAMRALEWPALQVDRAITGSTAWLPPIHVVHDPTDLIVLPVVLVPLRMGLRRTVPSST